MMGGLEVAGRVVAPNDGGGPADTVASRYDRQARGYRDHLASVLHEAGCRILAEFEGQEVRTALDVGTGVGTLLPRIQAAHPGALTLGCDGSRGMLTLAPPGTRVAQMDARRLAVSAESIDLCLCVFMLFLLEEPLSGLAEGYRVLRPGGRIGTVTWAGSFESRALTIWSECLEAHARGEPPPREAPGDEHVDTAGKMEALLSRAGFSEGRAWQEPLVVSVGPEQLIGMKTSVGRQKARWETLAPAAREACVSTARRRLAELDEEDFVMRADVVYAVGRKAGASFTPSSSRR